MLSVVSAKNCKDESGGGKNIRWIYLIYILIELQEIVHAMHLQLSLKCVVCRQIYFSSDRRLYIAFQSDVFNSMEYTFLNMEYDVWEI